jgi:transcriptional regulator with XRE-family HTH domain
MTDITMPHKQIHEGHNIKRFREMLGMKQDVLAKELGDDWTQKKISLLEAKETIELPVLQQVAAILQLPVEAIQNFDEEQAINIISNTVNNNDNATGTSLFSYNQVINPVEKWLESMEENKKLYERMLLQQQQMIERLEKLINK